MCKLGTFQLWQARWLSCRCTTATPWLPRLYSWLGQAVHSCQAHVLSETSIMSCADGCCLCCGVLCCLPPRLLATGGQDTLIHVWDLQQAVPQTTIYRPDEAVHALSFSADQALLAYCQEPLPGQPGSVEVMETTTGGQRLLCGSSGRQGVELCGWLPG